ncbi:hypothetical protein C5S39_11385 [Candidatus Methanophagaceae archaeon]|nr:hypothetical protein C5S39_11385 [Methanophagales archaeon]
MAKGILTKNMRDDAYILAEFNALREEIKSSALHISVVTSLAVIGILSQLKELNFILYPIPFLVLSRYNKLLGGKYQNKKIE